ncbi:MAG TPA: hypothetical protein VGM05_14235 [Planctomycetaceae bacterium]
MDEPSFPISREQRALRGINVKDMNEQRLRTWIDACKRMELCPDMERKGRRAWKRDYADAVAELKRRGLAADSDTP